MLFLADGDDVFRVLMIIVFMFVSFMGWVGQFVKNRQQGAERRPPKPQQGGQGADKNVQSEIERFLQEVTGQKQAQKPRPADPPRPPKRRPPQRNQDQAREQGRRNVERDEERRKVSTRSQQTASRSSSSSEKPRRVAKKVETAKPASKAPGSVQQSAYTAPPAAAQMPIAPPRRGTSAAGGRDVVATIGPSLVSQLRDPEQVRRAIMLNMILGPPKSISADSVLRSRSKR